MNQMMSPCDSANQNTCEACPQSHTSSQQCVAPCFFHKRMYDPTSSLTDNAFRQWMCGRSRPDDMRRYQAMCEQHAIAFNVDVMWKLTPKKERNMILFVLEREKFPLFILPLYLLTEQISFDSAARVLLSPIGFWILTTELALHIISLGALHSISTSVTTTKIFYTYLANYIGEILPWLMHGGEDVETLQISRQTLQQMKWNRLITIFSEAFAIGLSGSQLQILELPACGWKDNWKMTLGIWLQRYQWPDFAQKRCMLYIDQMLDNLEIIVNGAHEGFFRNDDDVGEVKQLMDSMESNLQLE